MKKFIILSLVLSLVLQGQSIDYTNQIKNKPTFDDRNYSTLSAACSAAGTSSLNSKKIWLAVPTLSCTAPVIFSGGTIQPAAGATITIIVQSAPASVICDTSLGGNCVFTSTSGVTLPIWNGGASFNKFSGGILAPTLAGYSTLISGNGYNAFPAACKGYSGIIGVIYRHGTSHSSDKGVLYLQKSSDKGSNFVDPTLLYSDITYDVRDPGCVRLPDNSILVTFFKSDYTGPTPINVYSIKCDKDFSNCANPVTVAYGGAASSSNPIVAANGNILQAVYGANGIQIYKANGVSVTSWALYGTISASTSASEPFIANRSDGSIYATIRDLPLNSTGISTSSNYGATWTSPNTGVFPSTSRAAVIEDNSGVLLFTFREYDAADASKLFQMGFRTSNDGVAFSNAIDTNDSSSGWFLYSSFVNVDNNSLIGTPYCFQVTASLANCYFTHLGATANKPLNLPPINGIVNVGTYLQKYYDGRNLAQSINVETYDNNSLSTTKVWNVLNSTNFAGYSWQIEGVQLFGVAKFASRFCIGTIADCASGVIAPHNIIRTDGANGILSAHLFGPTGTGIGTYGAAAGTGAKLLSIHNSGADIPLCLGTQANRTTAANLFCIGPSGGLYSGAFSTELPAGSISIGQGTYYAKTGGINATEGVTTLSSGTITVSTNKICTLSTGSTGCTVTLTLQTCSSCGILSVGTVTNATSFVINSSNGSDASKVHWDIGYIE